MVNKIFVIYDDKAKAYLPPFFLPEVGLAIRAVGDLVNDPQHNFGKHPKDFTLFYCGTFDDRSGSFSIEGSLSVVRNLWELKDGDEAPRQFTLTQETDGTLRKIPGSVPANGQVNHE